MTIRWLLSSLMVLVLVLILSACGTLEVGVEKSFPGEPVVAVSATASVTTIPMDAISPWPPSSTARAVPSPELTQAPSATQTDHPRTPSATATRQQDAPSPTLSPTTLPPSATSTETATSPVETPTATATGTPTATPEVPTPTLAAEQWRGEYYDNIALSGDPAVVRADDGISFTWGTGSPVPGTIGVDEFSVRWSRELELLSATYRFTMTVDDGGRLYVGGHLLIDAWRDQSVSSYTDDIFLPPGPVKVQMEYYENHEDAVAKLAWGRVEPTLPEAGWQTYTNTVFGVALDHPPEWELVEGYGEPEGGERIAGGDGFFLVNAMGDPADKIDDAVATESHHVLQPYGSQPVVETLQIQGQEARLILPSEDASMPDQAALIVRYAQPVTIGGHAYQFFVLYADLDHVRALAETLRFTVDTGGS